MTEEEKYQAILDVAISEGWEILVYTPPGQENVHGITIGTTDYVDKVQKHFDGEEDGDQGWIRPIK